MGNKKETSENNKKQLFDGAKKGNIFGSYLHGIFHNYKFRRTLLNYIRENKGLKAKFDEDPYESKKDYSIDKIAEIVEKNLDMKFIDDLIDMDKKD
jgi:adenosylcobyric acid synthase